jgi:hypothetical protein
MTRIGMTLGMAMLLSATTSVAAEIQVTPVQMIEAQRDEKTLGRLSWRRGFAMSLADSRFGGLSALQVSTDGKRIVAVTDEGNWLRAELTYRDGDLSGIRNPEMTPILDPDGKRMKGKKGDAESLAQLGPTSYVVAFERDHRLWRYDGTPDPFLARAKPVPIPARFAMLPDNNGIEALTTLCDGRLLAIAEGSRTAQGTVEGWIQNGSGGWDALTYPVEAGLRPTGATTLPDCDILLVERAFSPISGLEIRIARLTAASIAAGAVLAPQEIARMQPPVTMDNFEGISARRAENGDTLVYLVSDDSFSRLQRSLLVMFRLTETER